MFQDNKALGRYEWSVNGHTAFAEYQISGNRILFPHTVVPSELEGQGVGTALVNAALDDAQKKGMQVIPACSFVAHIWNKRQNT